MELAEFVYERLSARLETRDYIDWAQQLLDEGSNAPSVFELASYAWDAELDAVRVERQFQACIAELGLALPLTLDDAMLDYASSVCQKMILGSIEPRNCAAEMLTLSEDNQDPYIFWIWIDVLRALTAHTNDSLKPVLFASGLDLENSDECIRKTAAQFIALCSLPLPQKFPWVWWCTKCGVVSEDFTVTEIKERTCTACGAVSAMSNMRFFENREQYVRKWMERT